MTNEEIREIKARLQDAALYLQDARKNLTRATDTARIQISAAATIIGEVQRTMKE